MIWKTPARILFSFGCDPRNIIQAACRWPRYLLDIARYTYLRKANAEQRFPVELNSLHPFLLDKGVQAGQMGIYFHQDLFVAKLIYQRQPSEHLDVGSRIDGFIAHLLTFMPVTVVDIRSIDGVEGLSFLHGDATQLSMIPSESVRSLSCLHALEHFGLGRYGDKVDPMGWEKALSEMCRILAPEGLLYLSVPLGRERVEFNSQRVFSISTILQCAQQLTLSCVTIANAAGRLMRISDVQVLEGIDSAEHEGAVGIFEFVKSSFDRAG